MNEAALALKRKKIDLPETITKVKKSEIGPGSSGGGILPPAIMRTLYYDIRLYREEAWFETARRFEANPDSFYNAYTYLDTHPFLWRMSVTENEATLAKYPPGHEFWLEPGQGVSRLEVSVWRGQPDGTPSEDPALNTETFFDIEGGPQMWDEDRRMLDPEITTVAGTYEEAMIQFAKNVHKVYGNDRRKADKVIEAWHG